MGYRQKQSPPGADARRAATGSTNCQSYDPAVMAESARRLVGEGVELIDINFGCPAKKVCRKAAGSALLGVSI